VPISAAVDGELDAFSRSALSAASTVIGTVPATAIRRPGW
jgi:hypothetical protein